MHDKCVLVTGGAGFTGSNLANRLGTDSSVILVDDLFLGTPEKLDVAAIKDALDTDIDPEYIECPFDGYVHDTMADYSTFREATGWEPEIGFEEGVELVCEPYQ